MTRNFIDTIWINKCTEDYSELARTYKFLSYGRHLVCYMAIRPWVLPALDVLYQYYMQYVLRVLHFCASQHTLGHIAS